MTVPALTLTLTTAGLVRFTAAQVQEDIDLTVATVAVTAATFVAAPTLTAVPAEIKRIATISGQAIGSDIIHMVVRDDDPDTYSVRGFGLYLADGTLFAAYSQAAPICEKSALASLLVAIDLAFPTWAPSQMTFGDTNFLNPPATVDIKGVAAIATQAQVDAGIIADRIVTPATLASRLTAIANAILAAVAGMIASAVSGYVPLGRQVATSGAILKGGGTLAADRTLHVDAATLAEAIAAAAADTVITPAVLGPWLMSVIAEATIVDSVLGETGYRVHADGLIEQWGRIAGPFTSEQSRTFDFPIAFPSACFGVGGTVINSGGSGTGDTQIQEVSVSPTGATVYLQGDSGMSDAAGGFRWRAKGH